MRREQERVQRLVERQPAPREVCLRLRVLRVAVRVHLVAAGTEQRRAELGGDRRDERDREVDRRGRREAELARRGLCGGERGQVGLAEGVYALRMTRCYRWRSRTRAWTGSTRRARGGKDRSRSRGRVYQVPVS